MKFLSQHVSRKSDCRTCGRGQWPFGTRGTSGAVRSSSADSRTCAEAALVRPGFWWRSAGEAFSPSRIQVGPKIRFWRGFGDNCCTSVLMERLSSQSAVVELSKKKILPYVLCPKRPPFIPTYDSLLLKSEHCS